MKEGGKPCGSKVRMKKALMKALAKLREKVAVLSKKLKASEKKTEEAKKHSRRAAVLRSLRPMLESFKGTAAFDKVVGLLLLEFLKSTYPALKMSLKTAIAHGCRITGNLKYKISSVSCENSKNYMECDPTSSTIYANKDWLDAVASSTGHERSKQRFLMFCKLVHKYGHLLTRPFYTLLDELLAGQTGRNDFNTPPSIGSSFPPGVMGDAGFGLEQILLGGRGSHQPLGRGKKFWGVKELVLEECSAEPKVYWKVPAHYIDAPKDSFDSFKVPLEKQFKAANSKAAKKGSVKASGHSAFLGVFFDEPVRKS